MTGTALSLLLIASIALAVFLGYKTGINTGLFCIIFGYIIGCFVMGLAPKTIIGYWPISTMFVILAVSLFYNVAAANGTLENFPGRFCTPAGNSLPCFPTRCFSSRLSCRLWAPPTLRCWHSWLPLPC